MVYSLRQMKGGESMIFGVLKDIKNGEYRVIATPAEVGVLVLDGHTVLVQAGAASSSPASALRRT